MMTTSVTDQAISEDSSRPFSQKLRTRLIFDGRNLYEPSLLENFGLTYYAIGRGVVPGAKPVNYERRKEDKSR